MVLSRASRRVSDPQSCSRHKERERSASRHASTVEPQRRRSGGIRPIPPHEPRRRCLITKGLNSPSQPDLRLAFRLWFRLLHVPTAASGSTGVWVAVSYDESRNLARPVALVVSVRPPHQATYGVRGGVTSFTDVSGQFKVSSDHVDRQGKKAGLVREGEGLIQRLSSTSGMESRTWWTTAPATNPMTSRRRTSVRPRRDCHRFRPSTFPMFRRRQERQLRQPSLVTQTLSLPPQRGDLARPPDLQLLIVLLVVLLGAVGGSVVVLGTRGTTSAPTQSPARASTNLYAAAWPSGLLFTAMARSIRQ